MIMMRNIALAFLLAACNEATVPEIGTWRLTEVTYGRGTCYAEDSSAPLNIALNVEDRDVVRLDGAIVEANTDDNSVNAAFDVGDEHWLIAVEADASGTISGGGDLVGLGCDQSIQLTGRRE